MSKLPFPPPGSREDFRVWSVTEGAKNPGNWIFDAEALMASARLVLEGWRSARAAMFSAPEPEVAAEVMRERPEMWAGDVYMMLAGMAVEDLLKAVIVIRFPSVVQPDPSDPRRLLDSSLTRGHDLPRLADVAGVEVDTDDRPTLFRLSGFVQWAGRYPLATRLDWMSTSGLQGNLQSVEDPTDPDSVERLYEHLHAVAIEAQTDQHSPAFKELERQRDQERRTRIEEWLLLNTEREEGADGSVRFIAREPSEEQTGGSASSCPSCHMEIWLDKTVRAIICPCGTLQFIAWGYIGGDSPGSHMWRFPSEG